MLRRRDRATDVVPGGALERAVRIGLAAVAWVTFACHLLYVVGGVGRGWVAPGLVVDGLHNATYTSAALLCLVQARRAGRFRGAVFSLGAGMLLWTAANVYWTLALRGDSSPPVPSPADALWLSFYPAVCWALIRIARIQVRALPMSVVIDALITALAVAAIGTAAVIAPVAGAAPRSLLPALVAVAYPVADVVLLSVIACVVTITSRRRAAGWIVMTAGLALFALGDAVYAKEIADGSYRSGTLLDATWAAGMLVMAHAWTGRRRAAPMENPTAGWMTLIAPLSAALAAVGLLAYGNFQAISKAAIVLAMAAVAASAARMVLTVIELRGLAHSEREARTDPLTGLPNRRALFEALGRAIAGVQRDGGGFALAVIDMDGFKEINDTLGHFTGDTVLVEVGARLRRALRARDFVCRLGGDEFAAILPGVCDEDAARRLAARITNGTFAPHSIQGIDLVVRLSVGIAICPEHGGDAQSLFRHADVAMYQAKGARSSHAVYARDRDPNDRARLSLLADLQRALDARGELLLHYQPKIRTEDGALAGVEALARWQHPSGRMIPPGDFLDLAERTGLMPLLTHIVIEQALDQLAAWRAEGIQTEVAINLATTSLLDVSLPGTLVSGLERRGLHPSALRLEFTETAVMAEPERGTAVLAELRALGVGMSLDDFGTGYSSLAQLKHLPVDEIKVDKSFVLAMADDPGSAAIVRSTIDLARSLGLALVAEGVETTEARDELARLRCPYMQGFLFARPMPAQELTEWLRSSPDWLVPATRERLASVPISPRSVGSSA